MRRSLRCYHRLIDELTLFGRYLPYGLQTAQVKPLLKRVGMDTGDPSNHRPISYLNTMSKVLERLFISRLMPHVSGNFCPLQSSYRQYHSTETALLRITNDLFEAVDVIKAKVLVTLDLSAAFDTIDHSVLLRRLEHTFGVGGTALSWLRSYVHQLPSFVKTGTAQFSAVVGDTGVSQCSSLGPLLFSLFVTPLGGVISRFAVPYHQYADDTQLYIAVNKATATSASTTITACTTAIYEWLLQTVWH